jgi:hypothetical protein
MWTDDVVCVVQGGVEGRLPSEVGALLMPLLSSSSGGGGALIEVHAEALYSLTRIEYFTKVSSTDTHNNEETHNWRDTIDDTQLSRHS